MRMNAAQRWAGPIVLLAAVALATAACGDPTSSSDASRTVEPIRTNVAAPPSATATAPLPVATLAPSATHAAATPTSLPEVTPSATTSTRPSRVTEDFSTWPDPPWYNPTSPGSATARDGILTLDVPAGGDDELILQESALPNRPVPAADVWNSSVSNIRGWWVEVRMRVDPITDDQCGSDAARGPALELSAEDDAHMHVVLGFSRSCVALVYAWNQAVIVPMDTTSAFHVYRISAQLRHVRVYIDGVLAIEHDGSAGSSGEGLLFGDGQSGYGPTRSYWDHITYDVSGPSW